MRTSARLSGRPSNVGKRPGRTSPESSGRTGSSDDSIDCDSLLPTLTVRITALHQGNRRKVRSERESNRTHNRIMLLSVGPSPTFGLLSGRFSAYKGSKSGASGLDVLKHGRKVRCGIINDWDVEKSAIRSRQNFSHRCTSLRTGVLVLGP